MLTPERMIANFNALPEAERVELAEILTPRLAFLLTRVFGPEYAQALKRLDTYKARMQAARGSRQPMQQQRPQQTIGTGALPQGGTGMPAPGQPGGLPPQLEEFARMAGVGR